MNNNILFYTSKIKLTFFVICVLLYSSCELPDITKNFTINSSSTQTYPDGISYDARNRMIITQYGISWIFDKHYEAGQFINGDYYIVGPAKLETIFPKPANGRNGSMINPAVGTQQAYDDRAHEFNQNLSVTLPRSLNPGESLVSTISIDSNLYTVTDFANVEIPIAHAKLKTAAVLTCLSEKPDAASFRPPYIGTSKPLYKLNGSAASLLPELTFDLTSVMWSYTWFTTVFDTPYDYYIRGLKRPWIIHQFDWYGRVVHPLDNMKNYHADLNLFLGEASLLLMVSPGILSDKREELLIYYIQCGIDYYHMCTQGHGDAAFNAWPVIFTGIMLNNSVIYNAFINGDNYYEPAEIKMTYFLPADITSTRTSSILPINELWTGYIHPVHNTRPAWRQDKTDDEHEHLHPSEWAGCGDDPGGIKREAYRRINSKSYPAYVLSALLLDTHMSTLNVKSLFNHDSLFDYTDRWMDEDMTIHCQTISNYWDGITYGNPSPSSYQTSGSAFVDEMWVNYR